MAYLAYLFEGDAGLFTPDGLRAILKNALGVEPVLFVTIGGTSATVIVPDTVTTDAINAVMSTLGNVGYVIGGPVSDTIISWMSWRSDVQDNADAVLEDIALMLAEANADFAGWDAMTTNNKILASKRMLTRHITVLGYIRKIIKFVRYL